MLKQFLKVSVILLPFMILVIYIGISCTSDSYEATNPNDPCYITSLAPANVSASDGTYSNKIMITWDTVANATGYFVYRSTSKSGTCTTLFETAITANTYDDTTAIGGTNYYYKVSATKNGCTEFVKSNSDVGNKGNAPSGMVLVTGGTFLMGDTWGDGYKNGLPTHSVTISSFYMDETEVTTGEFEAFIISQQAPSSSSYSTAQNYTTCNINLSNPSLDNHPVNCVTWGAANAYCSWKGKRLPTEAEWEYAAGGGSAHWKWSLDENTFTLTGNYCWNNVNGNYTCEIKSYSPNSLGLYDMSGNVWEWCKDFYQYDFYNSCISGCTNPECTNTSLNTHVLRGGDYSSSNMMLLCTMCREHDGASYNYGWVSYSWDRYDKYGFRCVLN